MNYVSVVTMKYIFLLRIYKEEECCLCFHFLRLLVPLEILAKTSFPSLFKTLKSREPQKMKFWKFSPDDWEDDEEDDKEKEILCGISCLPRIMIS